jgi:hypothetical protein
MKKQLHQEIQQLAKDLIALDENFDTVELQKRVAELFEQLAVLRYFEKQVSGIPNVAKPMALDSKSYREENWFKEPEPIPASGHKEDLVEPLMEKIKDLVAQMPPESSQVDELLEDILPKKKYIKNDLEEFASNYQQTPTFERKTAPEITATIEETTLQENDSVSEVEVPKKTKRLLNDLDLTTAPSIAEAATEKPRSLNDAVNNGMAIGLNDRLAFIKHLFNESADDYTRVLSQINTFTSFDEAQSFIKGKVKPDYNYWSSKDEYVERFMTVVEKRFN